MRPPREYAEESERHPQLPRGSEERVAGYGVMGQTFGSPDGGLALDRHARGDGRHGVGNPRGRQGLHDRATANGLPFDANPLRIWRVVDATATINGTDAGLPAPLPKQAHPGDFWIPQRGIFAMGHVFVGTPGCSTSQIL